MNKLICFAFAMCVLAAQAVTVSGVSARQRWPWNNLVDVDFTVVGTPGEAYVVEMNAVCSDGRQNLTCKSMLSEPIVYDGENRIVWDFGRDYPDFKADDMRVIVLATPLTETTPIYLVFDVSAGASATSYPVYYTTKDPVHTVGANDPCKTTEIWLKRVKAGGGWFGGNTNYGYAKHSCTLTEDYYLGIFPVTQSQWEHVGSGTLSDHHSFFTNSLYAATRPVDSVNYSAVRDSSFQYPANLTISQDTFIKRLRDRTGLEAIDLPTEWQWEYAHRRGAATGGTHSGAYIRSVAKNNALPEGMAAADRDGTWTEDYGTCYVDRDTPTAWGFYSMLGNVWEWCANANAKSAVSGGTAPDDYKGPESTSNYRVLCGGCWSSSSQYYCMNYSRNSLEGNKKSSSAYGFRLAMTVHKSK